MVELITAKELEAACLQHEEEYYSEEKISKYTDILLNKINNRIKLFINRLSESGKVDRTIVFAIDWNISKDLTTIDFTLRQKIISEIKNILIPLGYKLTISGNTLYINW